MATKKKADPPPSRVTYDLNGIQQQGLYDARSDPGTRAEAEAAFWLALSKTMGFNPDTVEVPDDPQVDFNTFTAWPAGYEPPVTGGDALSKAHDRAIADMIEAVPAAFDPAQMVFDVRDTLLTMLRSQDRLMHQKTEAEQQDQAAACEHIANELVRGVAEGIASRGVQSVRALVTKVTLGDDIVVNVKAKPFTPAETDDAVMMLHRAHGKHVLITMASADDFKEGGREADIDADEPPLDFDAD